MLLVQKKRRKQDDPEETYVLVAGFVDLHDINQNVHLSGSGGGCGTCRQAALWFTDSN